MVTDYFDVKLETKDLILKKAEFEDWKTIYYNLWRHKESAKYMLWQPTETDEDAKDRMKRTIAFEEKPENKYALFVYLKKTGEAIGFAGMRELEPDMMTVEEIDEEGIRTRLRDSFYEKSASILAMENNQVVGRIEYHFYGCIQGGYRMAYVNWVYVLPEYRHSGVARRLFAEFEKDCKKHDIHQYYLIRATNENADRFYKKFEGVQLDEEPMLRKILKDN